MNTSITQSLLVLSLIASTTTTHAADNSTTLPIITVTANPLGKSDSAAPVSSLAGDALTLRRASTLGETLQGLPGVSSTYFGPNASRPTIRGLDGERVKILSNAGASIDASSLSFDHAVPIDPLIIERLEVLRGPGSLLYGGASIGGVVNALDNRIPKIAQNGVSGTAELRLGGAESERAGAAIIEAGNAQFTWHVDAFDRKTSDLRVPSHTPIDQGQPLAPTRKVRNSDAQTYGGAIGGSLFFEGGHTGISLDTTHNRYGVVADPGLRIDMQRDHLGWAGEIKPSASWLRSVRSQFNHTRYQHQEIEADGQVGTTFKSQGNELRLEAQHQALGPWQGVVGLQLESQHFSALGEEAFVPFTETRKWALFITEELAWSGGNLSLGARSEHVSAGSRGDPEIGAVQFGTAQSRRFNLGSLSVSNLLKLSPNWSASTGLSYSERAPSAFELYANGLHAATGAFEIGNSQLGPERALQLELSSTWKTPQSQLRVGLFGTHFSRYLALEDTDQPITNAALTSVPQYRYTPVRARMLGLELDAQHRLVEPTADSAWSLDLSSKLDLTRARNLSRQEPLPRIAPLRISVGLEAKQLLWSGKIETQHYARQSQVPSTDTPTSAYTTVQLELSRRLSLGAQSDALAFLKLTNLTNALGYSASSTASIRPLSPVPGRALKLGVRARF
jgi:iron complex outermembrane recepter protein